MAIIKEAKTELEAIEAAKNELHTEKIIYKTEEIKGGLFKAKTYKVTAISYQDLIDEIKQYLKETVLGLGLNEINFESTVTDNDTISITMYSDNNSILIGHNGRTLKSLETLVRTKISKDWNIKQKIVLDVSNYNEKRIKYLERLAVNTAREVRKTKMSVELENMNSYERRIVHNKLTKFKNISTKSEGEEPKRHIVVRYEEIKEAE